MAAFPPSSANISNGNESIQCTSTDAAFFRTRIGPNYSKHRKKEISGPALYEVYNIRVFRTNQSFEQVAEQLPKPTAPAEVAEVELPPHVPRFLYVTWNFPIGSPSFTKTPTSGPTFLLVFIFVVKASTALQLRSTSELANASPAVKLFDSWCRDVLVNGEENAEVKGRFKAIAGLYNLDEVNLSSLVKSYNAKPVLIKKTGSVTRGADHLEISVNVFKWSYQARLGFHSCLSTFTKALIDVGFVIEGRSDEELPEVILGCGRICYPDAQHCEPWPPIERQPIARTAEEAPKFEVSGGAGGGVSGTAEEAGLATAVDEISLKSPAENDT